jgi:hypothetical protein
VILLCLTRSENTRYHSAIMNLALPGADLIESGLRSLAESRSPEREVGALLVSIGAPRLRSLGFLIERVIENPEDRLYELLTEEHGDAAHTRYNAYIRLLVSYERSIACASGPV